jgi:hypothetical protein
MTERWQPVGAWLAAAAIAATLAAGGCASEPPPKKRARVQPAAEAEPVAVKVPVKAAPAADKSAALAAELGVEPGEVKWSPDRKAFAMAVPPKAENPTDSHKVAVFTEAGQPLGELEPPRPGAISELRFLGEERIFYLLVPKAAAATAASKPKKKEKAAKKRTARRTGKRKGKGAVAGAVAAAAQAQAADAPASPPSLYVIHPLSSGATPLTCLGRRFVFSPKEDHVAWVGGEPGREFVGADGVQVYPRSGFTTVQGEPAWSLDGASLALIETRGKPSLVVLVEVDNPNGDNVWPLPPEATLPGLKVFWAGEGKIVVGNSITEPAFATSYKRQPNPPGTP